MAEGLNPDSQRAICRITFGSTPYCEANLFINSFICSEENFGWGIGGGVLTGVGFGVGFRVGVGVKVGMGVKVGVGEGVETVTSAKTSSFGFCLLIKNKVTTSTAATNSRNERMKFFIINTASCSISFKCSHDFTCGLKERARELIQ